MCEVGILDKMRIALYNQCTFWDIRNFSIYTPAGVALGKEWPQGGRADTEA